MNQFDLAAKQMGGQPCATGNGAWANGLFGGQGRGNLF